MYRESDTLFAEGHPTRNTHARTQESGRWVTREIYKDDRIAAHRQMFIGCLSCNRFSTLHFSCFTMTGSSLRPRSIFILIYLLTSIPRTATHTPEHGKHSLDCSFDRSASSSLLEPSRIHQKILVGPQDIVTHPGGTVQFPCIVSKESDAIVTWCWNDFCTLGKAQFLRHETSSDGPISIYQYAAYPRFQLFINERLSTYRPLLSRCISTVVTLLQIILICRWRMSRAKTKEMFNVKCREPCARTKHAPTVFT